MNRLSFYDPHKTYSPEPVSWPQESDLLELTQMGDGNLGFVADIGTRFEVVNPVFYFCGGKGIARLNRSTFVEVRIPERLLSRVRRCSSIEITVSYPENSFESFRATVNHLLRFPDLLMHDMPSREIPDIDLDELERPLQADEKMEPGGPDGGNGNNRSPIRRNEKGRGDSGEAEANPYGVHASPRAVFEEWIAGHGGEIVSEFPDGCLLAHDGHNLLLVSFFDEDETFWLTDEDKCSDEPPFWFSESGRAVSPLYRLKLAAELFSRVPDCNVLPFAILSDHIEIVCAEETAEEWKRLGMHVCYCRRTEPYADTFERFLESAAKNGGDFCVPGAESMNELKRVISDTKKEKK